MARVTVAAVDDDYYFAVKFLYVLSERTAIGGVTSLQVSGIKHTWTPLKFDPLLASPSYFSLPPRPTQEKLDLC